MMKMSQRVTVCCVALFLTLTSVSAVQRLKSINDLRKINIGRSVPKHSLVLLHWFADTVEIDNNNGIWLTFDPDNGDYGSHPYHNREGLLDPLPQRQLYYTIGNINRGSSVELPSYVVHHGIEDIGRNMARIIIRVREQSRGRRRIDHVYITQHYGYGGTIYDQQHTYQVTPNLLREIQELPELRDNIGSDTDELWDIRNTCGDLASLSLLLFIVIGETYNFNKRNRPQSAARGNTQPDFVVDIPENRQNTCNADDSDTCRYSIGIGIFILLICILLIIYFFHR